MSKLNKIIIAIIVLVVVIFAVRFFIGGSEDSWICDDGQWVKHGQPSAPKPVGGCDDGNITSFDDCVAAGYPIAESYPPQCIIEGGSSFAQDIGNELEKIDLIRIDTPRPQQVITSPLIIKGQARGFWFFEAEFMIELQDGNGQVIGVDNAWAQSDWMTEEFVSFEAAIEYSQPSTKKGNLILKKANMSGLLENDDELRVPVEFMSY